MYIDAHCHLADHRYTPEYLAELMKRSLRAEITGWVQGGIHPKDWERQLEIQNLYGRGVITSFGLHPWWLAEASEEEFQNGLSQLEIWGKQAQAIGETGLDYQSRFKTPQILARQWKAFEAQIILSKSFALPLILHIVRAHRDAIYTLKKYAPYPNRGIIHSFSGSLEDAREYIALGFFISFSGSVTRMGGTKNSFQRFRKVVPGIPLDKIMIETDSPDQMPQLSHLNAGPESNCLNEPAYLISIAESLSGLVNADCREVLQISTNHIQDLFGI